MRTRGTRLLIFFSLYSRRSFLSISLAFENPLSITLSLYPRLFKWWRKSPSLCLVVSTVEHIRFTLMAWLNGILLKQCLGWQLLGERYSCLSVGLEYSCHVALLDRGGSIKEGHFGFRYFVCEFYWRMDTVGMFEKFLKLFIAMYPLHVNVIYKSEPWKILLKWREE